MRVSWDNIAWSYVNLDHRADRRAHAEQEFAKHGITPRRQPGLLTTRDTCRPSPLTERMYNRTPGAIGCWLSQVAALCATPADKIAAVCEDDICFCDDLRIRIEYLGERLPHYWDMVWLGATCHCNPPKWHAQTLGRDADRVGPRLFRAYGLWGTYGYLINPTSRDKICQLLDEHMADSDGIDDCFIKFLEPQLWTYFMVPGCAWQYDNKSNIGTGVTEFSLFKHLGPYAWATRMEDFDPDTFDWSEAADYVYCTGRDELIVPARPLPPGASLAEMGNYFDTDKGRTHDYLATYDELFSSRRHAPLTLLEIGVSAGGSLQMWLEYFTQARVVGVDLNIHAIPPDPRLAVLQSNQTDRARMHAIGQEVTPDVVIDDGDHNPTAQIAAFEALWPSVAPGGMYVIEDLQQPATCIDYWKRTGLPVSVHTRTGNLCDALIVIRKTA